MIWENVPQRVPHVCRTCSICVLYETLRVLYFFGTPSLERIEIIILYPTPDKGDGTPVFPPRPLTLSNVYSNVFQKVTQREKLHAPNTNTPTRSCYIIARGNRVLHTRTAHAPYVYRTTFSTHSHHVALSVTPTRTLHITLTYLYVHTTCHSTLTQRVSLLYLILL